MHGKHGVLDLALSASCRAPRVHFTCRYHSIFRLVKSRGMCWALPTCAQGVAGPNSRRGKKRPQGFSFLRDGASFVGLGLLVAFYVEVWTEQSRWRLRGSRGGRDHHSQNYTHTNSKNAEARTNIQITKTNTETRAQWVFSADLRWRWRCAEGTCAGRETPRAQMNLVPTETRAHKHTNTQKKHRDARKHMQIQKNGTSTLTATTHYKTYRYKLETKRANSKYARKCRPRRAAGAKYAKFYFFALVRCVKGTFFRCYGVFCCFLKTHAFHHLFGTTPLNYHQQT